MRAYGWTSKGEPVDDEAAVLREMAERVANDEPIKQIAADLNDRGVPTVSGRPWVSRTISRSVSSPRAIGLRERGGELVDDPDVTAILDVPVWERVRERLTSADRQRFTPQRRRQTPLLGGLLRCSSCDGPMYLTGVNYICGGSPNCPGVMTIRRTIADTEATERVLVHITSEPWLQALRPVAEYGADHWRAVVADSERRMTRLAEEFGDGGPQEAFDAGLRAARARLADAQQQLDTLAAVDGLPELTEEAVVTWWADVATDADKHAVIAAVVDHITVGDGTGPRRDRLVFSWR